MLDDDEYVGWWMMMNDAAADDDDDCDSWLWFQALIYLASCLSLAVGYSLHWLKGACRWHMWSTRTFSSLMEVYPGQSSEVSFFSRACSLTCFVFRVCWYGFSSYVLRLVLSLYEFFLVFSTLVKNLPAKFQEKGVLNNMKKWRRLVCFFFFFFSEPWLFQFWPCYLQLSDFFVVG